MNNSKIANFRSQTLIFQIEKKTHDFLIFHFGQFQKRQIWKIPKICNLANLKKFLLKKFEKFPI